MKRGEVWTARFDPAEGNEIQKTRPGVIVSPPEIHDHLRIVLIAPLTSGSRPAPYRVPTTFGGRPGFVLLEQTRTMSKQRLIARRGLLDDQELDGVLAGLQAMFAP
jgi:mRNA interferase MazF